MKVKNCLKKVLALGLAFTMVAQNNYQYISMAVNAEDLEPVIVEETPTPEETPEVPEVPEVPEEPEVTPEEEPEEEPEESPEGEEAPEEDEEETEEDIDADEEDSGKTSNYNISKKSDSVFRISELTLVVTEYTDNTSDGKAYTYKLVDGVVTQDQVSSHTFDNAKKAHVEMAIKVKNEKGETFNTLRYTIDPKLNAENVAANTARYSNAAGTPVGYYTISNHTNLVIQHPSENGFTIDSVLDYININIRGDFSLNQVSSGDKINVTDDGDGPTINFKTPVVADWDLSKTCNSYDSGTGVGESSGIKPTYNNKSGLKWDSSENKYYADYTVKATTGPNNTDKKEVTISDRFISNSEFVDHYVVRDPVTKGDVTITQNPTTGGKSFTAKAKLGKDSSVSISYRVYFTNDFTKNPYAELENQAVLSGATSKDITKKFTVGFKANFTIRKSCYGKSTSNELGVDKNGYYVDYHVAFIRNNDANVTVSGIRVEDKFTTGKEYIRSIGDFKFDGKAINATVNKEGNVITGFTIDSLPAFFNLTELTYRVYYDPGIAFDFPAENGAAAATLTNTITGTRDAIGTTPALKASSSATITITKEWIVKDGEEQDNGTVKFLLKANDLTKFKFEGASLWQNTGGSRTGKGQDQTDKELTITDTLGSGWRYSDGNGDVNGYITVMRYAQSGTDPLETFTVSLADAKKNGGVTISDIEKLVVNEPADCDANQSSFTFTGKSNYYYELVYYAAPTPKNIGAKITNSAGVGIEGKTYKYMHQWAGESKFSYDIFIKKIGTGISKDSNTASWQTNFEAIAYPGLTITDTRQNNYFYLTPAQLNNVKVMLHGKEVSKSSYDIEAVAYADQAQQQISSFKITFKTQLDGTDKDPISIIYDTTLVDGYFDGSSSLPTLSNEADAEYTDVEGNHIIGAATAQQSYKEYQWVEKTVDPAGVEEKDIDGDGKLDTVITWDIKVNPNGVFVGAVDLYDFLPAGFDFVSAKLLGGDKVGANAKGVTILSQEVNSSVDENGFVQKDVHWTLGNFKKTDDETSFVTVQVVSVCRNYEKLAAEGKVKVTNRAKVVYNGNSSIDDSDAGWENHVATKTMNEDKYKLEGPTMTFTLEVNKAKKNLLGDNENAAALAAKYASSDSEKKVIEMGGKYYLLFTDSMSDLLTYAPSTIQVVGSTSGQMNIAQLKFTADADGHGFSIYLPVDEMVTVTYNAKNNTPKDGTSILENKAGFVADFPARWEWKGKSIVVIDTVTKGAINISKFDSATQQTMDGVTFALKKVTISNGKPVYTDVTTDTTKSGMASFQNLDETSVYAVVETATLPGYAIDNTYSYFSFNKDAQTDAFTKAGIKIQIGDYERGITTVKYNKPTEIDITKTFKGNAADGKYYFGVFDSATATTPTKNAKGETLLGSIEVVNGKVKGSLTFDYLKLDSNGNGTYYVYETDANGKKLATNGATINGSKYTISGGGKVVVTNANPKASTTIINEETKNGSLTIEKKLIGETSGTFTFNVKGADGRYYGTDAKPKADPVDISLTYTANGQNKVVIDNLPAQEYTVTEVGDNLAQYTVTYTNKGKATVETGSKDASVTVTNTLKTGGLTVKKVVDGNDGDTTKVFHFTATFTPALTGTADKYGVAIDNGTATFELKHDESVTFKNLPKGTKYAIAETEANADGYVTTWTNQNGTIDGETSVEVTATNTKDTFGGFTVKKVVTGNAVDQTKKFKFKVTLSDNSINGTAGVNGDYGVKFDAGKATFELGNGESKAIKNLPTGTTYTIVEDVTSKGDYVLSWDTSKAQTITGEISENSNYTYTATNTRDKDGGLTIKKETVGKNGSFDFQIVVTPAINKTLSGVEFKDGVGTFTLKGGESKTISGLAVGTHYVITETKASGYTTKVNDKEGNVAEGDITENTIPEEKFQNTYTAKGEKVLEGKKDLVGVWEEGDEFEFVLANAEGTIDTQTVDKKTEDYAFKFKKIDFNLAEEDGEVYIKASTGEKEKVDANRSATFKYTITEKHPDEATEDKGHNFFVDGLKYDGHKVEVEIIVKDNEDGTMTATSTYDKVSTSYTFKNVKDEIIGELGPLKLSGTKKVRTFNGTVPEKEFEFAIYEADENFNITDEEPMATVKSNTTDGSFAYQKDDAFTHENVGSTYYYVIKEVIPEEALMNNNFLDGYTYTTASTNVTVKVIRTAANKVDSEATYAPTSEFVNTYEAKGTLAFNGVKSLNGTAWASMDQVDKDNLIADTEFTLYEVNDGVETAIDTATLDADGTFTFFKDEGDTPIAYSLLYGETQVHTYRVKETATNPLYALNKKVFEYVVTVEDDNRGGVTTTVDNNQVATITTAVDNTIDHGSITVNKEFTGAKADGTYYFTLVKDGTNVITKPLVITEGKAETVVFGTLDFGTYTVMETKDAEGTALDVDADGNSYVEVNGVRYIASAPVTKTISKDTVTTANVTVEFTNTESVTAKLSVSKRLVSKDLEDKEFTFTLSDKDGVIESHTNNGQGVVAFDKVFVFNYNQAGTYTYTITESKTNKNNIPEATRENGGMKYDTTQVTAKIVVGDSNSDGKLDAVVTYDDAESYTFVNEYVSEGEVTIDVAKLLKEYETWKDIPADIQEALIKEVSFTIKEDENEPSAAKYLDKDGKLSFATFKYDFTYGQEQVHTYVVHEDTTDLTRFNKAEDQTVVVTFEDQKDGTVKITKITLDGKEVESDKVATPFEVSFTNELKVGELEVAKMYAEDSEYKKDKEFTFTITADEEALVDLNKKYPYSLAKISEPVDEPSEPVAQAEEPADEPTEPSMTVQFKDRVATIVVPAGFVATIKELPIGNFTVEEVEDSAFIPDEHNIFTENGRYIHTVVPAETTTVIEGNVVNVTVENTYAKRVGMLSVQKVIDKKNELKGAGDKVFTFEVTTADADVEEGTYAYTMNGKVSEVSFTKSADGKYYYTTIQVEAGKVAVFDALPIGQYTVKEIYAGVKGYELTTTYEVMAGKGTATGKDVTVLVTEGTIVPTEPELNDGEVKEDGDESTDPDGDAEEGYIVAEAKIINKYVKEKHPNTGVETNVSGYAGAMAIAGLAGAALLLTKKRKDEE